MGTALILHRLLHFLCEWGAALGVIFWIAQSWRSAPAPLPVSLARHPRRMVLAFAFGVAPAVIGMLLWWPLVQLHRNPAWSSLAMPVSYLLSLLYGVLVGLAASCCAATATLEERFRFGAAVAISAGLAIAPFALGTIAFQPKVYMLGDIVLATLILSIARLCMSGEGGPSPVSAALALIISFIPSALLLGAFTVASASKLPRDQSNALLWLCGVVSLICCFAASIALFTRKTGWAIAGGIALLLLNGCIAFFFGCCASIQF